MDEKQPPRLMGWTLRVAARLMETKGTGALLYQKAAKQMGLEALRGVAIPTDTVPYWPRHLCQGRAPVAAETAQDLVSGNDRQTPAESGHQERDDG